MPAADVAACEAIEALAMEDMFAAAPAAFKAATGAEAARVAGALCMTLPVAPTARELNRVILSGTHADAAELDAIDAWYAERHAGYVIGVTPPAAYADLREELTGRGFCHSRTWSMFVYSDVRREPRPPTDLVVDAATAEEVGAIVPPAFGMPDAMAAWLMQLVGRPRWTALAARDSDGRAVGCGLLFIDGDAAWLGLGATRAEGRGRGAQRLLLDARVKRARAAGAQLVRTETGSHVPGLPDQSLRNISRAGFQVAYEREHWASPAFGG